MKIELGGRVFYTNQPHVFSAGEVHLDLKKILQEFPPSLKMGEEFPRVVRITMNITCSNHIMELTQAVEILRNRCNNIKINLVLPYLPYSRQDRATTEGTSYALMAFGNLLNSMNFNTVTTYDVHSDAAYKCIDDFINIPMSSLVNGWDTLSSFIQLESFKYPIALIAPDKGAKDKVSGIFDILAHDVQHLELFVADKTREPNTGKITSHTIDGDFEGKACFIFDDICDGGATFIGLAKQLKDAGAKKVYLYVTHGIFSKGTDELNQYIDEIFCYNSICKNEQQLKNVRIKNGI